MTSTSAPSTRPLLVTADDDLLDALLRLCAAAGVTPTVAADASAARRSWSSAGLVVVGDDLAPALARVSPGRRVGVVVVVAGVQGPDVWPAAVGVGAESVLGLPADESDLVDRLAGAADSAAREATVVGVVGGAGGAGASTLAAGLAITAARTELSCLLVDADPLGGGIDLVLGSESSEGVRWPDLAGTEGRVDARSLRRALPRTSTLSVLSWDRSELLAIPAESMRSVVTAGQRSHDLVVVDLPRRLDPAAEEALLRTSTVIVVVPADVRGTAAASRVLPPLRERCADLRLVARAPAVPSTVRDPDVATTLGLPVAATLRFDDRVARSVECGLGPLSGRRRLQLAAACESLLDGLLPGVDAGGAGAPTRASR